jgi:hypothetical protein
MMKIDKNTENSKGYEISLAEDERRGLAQDQFGKLVARNLDQSLEDLSPKAKLRLEQSRELAISKKKPEKAFAWANRMKLAGHGLSSSNSGGKWLRGASLIAPMIALTIGLLAISQWQQDSRIDDIAEVDTALLSDEVPPDAYADNGFWVFLKNLTNEESKQSSDSESSLTK